MAKKFKRSRDSQGKNTKDDRGTVVVTMILRDGNTHKKGNISRSVSIGNAKVSEVHKEIINALFED